MSASMDIPKAPVGSPDYRRRSKESSSPASSSYSSMSSPITPSSATAESRFQPRRPSLLSSSISKQESTVINIGDPEGPPRLISYLSSSQGFDWNPEIFLPSYIDCDYVPLENRREPVHEITLTDEESRNLLPS